MTSIEILLNIVYYSLFASILWVGKQRYASLLPSIRILYWSVLLDCVTELVGTIYTDVLNFNSNQSIYTVYTYLSALLYFLFFNATLPNMGFKVNFYKLGMALLLYLVLLFGFFKNGFDIYFFSSTLTSSIVVLFALYAIAYTFYYKSAARQYLSLYIFIVFAFLVDIVLGALFNMLVYIYKFDLYDVLYPLHLFTICVIYFIYYRLLYNNKDLQTAKQAIP